jgi:hypothetical protein
VPNPRSLRAALPAALAALALAAGAAAPAAQATTAAVADGVLTVTGGPGTDELQIVADATTAPPTLVVKQSFAAVLPGPGCSADASGSASCPLDAISLLRVALGDGDDSLQVRVPVPVEAFGEGGDDALLAGEPSPPFAPAPATLDGGDGADRLGGTVLNDTLRGGPGDDAFDGHAGDDVLDLGPGADSVNDLSGDDRVEARDGTADRVDCGPGTDTGSFDAIDTALNCELGVLPPAPVADCTPDVRRPALAALRRLRATGTLVVAAAATDSSCGVRARLLLGGRALTSARVVPAAEASVRLRVRGTALRRLRRAARIVLSVTGSGAGAPSRTRRLTLRLR